MNGESQSSSGDLNHPGTLIVFDGIDASGKSTQVRLLAETLRASGHLVIVSGEPTDSVWGQRLRRPGSRLPLSLESLYSERDRSHHVSELIHPALRYGHIVLLNRYYYSTAAYQGARGGDAFSLLQRSKSFAPTPDLTFFLDLPVSETLARHDEPDALSQFEQPNYLRRVRTLFCSLARWGHPDAHHSDESILMIDATQSISEIHISVCNEVHSHIGSSEGV